MTDTPGLVKRELLGTMGDHVLIRETWNLKAPGCPIIAMRGTSIGDNDAVSLQRDVVLSREEWMFADKP